MSLSGNIKILSFFAGAMLSSIILAHNASAATHSLNVTSSGIQTIDIATTGDGVAISTDEINVTTTCRYGYNFVINTSVNDNNLYLAGNASNNTAGTYFSPVNGTSTLDNSTNAWGYFYNSDSSVIPTKSSVFSPVPALGQTAIIKSASSTEASSDINDSFNLYYGVKTSLTMTSGAYKMIPDTNNQGHDGTIVYQATIADNCMRYTVEFNPTSTAGGTTLSGTGTMNNQNIYEDVATPLTSNGFTAPTGYYFAGWNTAQDGTGTTYTNGQNVTNITTIGSTITLYAQWTDCPGGKICYKENGANVVGTMGQQTISSSATSLTLLASNFSRTGYGFAGWSDVEDYATNPNTHFYGPQEDITFTAGQYAIRGLKLYAVWVQSAGSLQSDTASVCATLATAPTDGTANLSSVSALTDERDNQTYAIAKLADGNCWMIENLRLEAEDTRSDANKALAQGYGTSTTYGNFSGLADAESTSFTATAGATDVTVANSLYYAGTQSGTATIDISRTSYAGYRMPRYNNTNTSARASSPTRNGTAMYSYGNYYTWAAAMANTGYYNTTTMTDGYTLSEAANTSLCPTGWRLPYGRNTANSKGTTAGGFSYLDTQLGGTGASSDSSTIPTGNAMSKAWLAFPNNFLRSGSFGASVAYGRGTYGYYWSSTAHVGSDSYYLYLHSSYVYPGTDYDFKYYGYSIRCVADKPYMQDMTQAKLSALMPNTGDEVTLYDKRDDKPYTVAKLADGNFWMTQNLDHDIKTDGSVTYDNTTTDLGWNGTSYNTASWSPASATKATSNTTWTKNSTGNTIPESYDPGELYWNGTAGYYSSESACTTAGGTWDSTNNVCNQISSTGDSYYHLGNYYNWTAAVAMNDSSSYTTYDQDVNQSICPAGWTLPKSGSNTSSGSFQYLFEQYGWSSSQMTDPNIWNTAIKLPLSGYWYGSLGSVGDYGGFWSPVVSNVYGAYNAGADSVGYVGPGYFSNRYYGRSLRCIAR